MKSRLNYAKCAPLAMQLLFKQEAHIVHKFNEQGTLSIEILNLIKLSA